MLKLTVVLALVALVVAQKGYFKGYKVFRLTPSTEEQNLRLLKLAESPKLDFWIEPSFVNATSDLMLAPDQVSEFERMMRATGIKYETFVEDVQNLIDEENPSDARAHGFGWKKYHSLPDIYDFLESTARAHPDKVKVIVGGKTYEGRQIKGVKVSFKENNPGIFIEGGIHAREWISPATVTFILNELLNSKSPKIRNLAENNDWYIFPSINPDGYVYSHHVKNRMWRKNRKPHRSGCVGVDMNRNWGYRWMEAGASNRPCSEVYAGSAPFSEIETKSLSDYITSLSGKIYAYITFHSYSQLLLFPYGHTEKHLENYNELSRIGKKAVDALAQRYGTKYKYGNIAEVLSVATGGSEDWAKATLKVPLAYTYELRDTGRYGFILPAELIIPTGLETLDSLAALFEEARILGIPNKAVTNKKGPCHSILV